MDMEHRCSLCPFWSDSVDVLSAHLFRRHKHSRNFMVHCSACGSSFRKIDSFKKHYKREHYKNIPVTVPDSRDDVVDVDGLCQEFSIPSCKKEEAVYLLKLKAGHQLSDSAVSDVVSATKELLKSKCQQISQQLAQRGILTSNVCDDICTSQHLFEGLESNYKQEQFFEEHFSYVKPVAAKLGLKDVMCKKKGKYVWVKRAVFGYYVPFLSQLGALLSLPEVHQCVHYPVTNVSVLMTDFTDGTAVHHDIHSQSSVPHLHFSLYSDELEIVNPIGTHRKTHKITVFYWSLLNIASEFRHKMHVIQLAALVRSKHLKEFGYSVLLDDLCSAFVALGQGVELHVMGYGMCMYTGCLTYVLADTLAAQFLGGFKESVGPANKPCRTCEISKGNLNTVFYHAQCHLRTEEEHRDRMSHLQTVNKREALYWSKQWGVKENSIRSRIPDFHLTSALLHDPMHVILEGIARYELRAMFRVFVLQKKYFSLKVLNERIACFEYSFGFKDKPMQLDKSALDRGSTLGQTAASMMTLMVSLPFLIGDTVPEDDLNWKNFLRLLQITLLCVSAVASTRTVNSLRQLIAVHNCTYFELYPDESCPPKFHYMIHFPEQIVNFGPLRSHWCIRYEAKNGFFKRKRWFNFMNIAKSLAFYHQRWICLNMLEANGERSESFLYAGDEVSEGTIVPTESVRHILPSAIPVTDDVMQTDRICVKGLVYAIGTVLLHTFEDEPQFMKIEKIYVVQHQKFLLVRVLKIVTFVSHKNAFCVHESDESQTLDIGNLQYKWPQIAHVVDGTMFVMLYNSDEVWTL